MPAARYRRGVHRRIQVRQIKALSASGDRLGAQKVHPAELNKEFSAESARAAGTTFAGALERLKNKASDVLRTDCSDAALR